MTLRAQTFFSALVRATGKEEARRLVGDRAEGYVPLKVRTRNEAVTPPLLGGGRLVMAHSGEIK